MSAVVLLNFGEFWTHPHFPTATPAYNLRPGHAASKARHNIESRTKAVFMETMPCPCACKPGILSTLYAYQFLLRRVCLKRKTRVLIAGVIERVAFARYAMGVERYKDRQVTPDILQSVHVVRELYRIFYGFSIRPTWPLFCLCEHLRIVFMQVRVILGIQKCAQDRPFFRRWLVEDARCLVRM